MSKIDELFQKYDLNYLSFVKPSDSDNFLQLLKEYAEWYAKECLKIAADNAECTNNFFEVDINTILDINLPEHEHLFNNKFDQ